MNTDTRPTNPPFILVRYDQITPGDVLLHYMPTDSNGGGVYLRRTVRIVSTPYHDPRYPWLDRVVTFTDGSTTRIGNLAMQQVCGGPKYDQRRDVALVRWYGYPVNQMNWIGE